MKRTAPLITTSTGWPSLRRRCLFITLMLGSSAALHAVSPPPDGSYPGFNTAEGQNALLSLDTSTGLANTAVGALSLQSSVDASFNTGVGAGTLSLNTGNENTAVGAAALFLNTAGEANTAVGVDALLNNTTGSENTANGAFALFSNTGGNDNTATGISALQSNTTGFGNTANGSSALFSNTEGGRNTANGEAVLFFNTTGDENTANGALSLQANTEGSGNTAVGVAALTGVITGNFNTAIGENAGDNLSGSDSNNIDIGANVEGVAGDNNTIRIGNPDIATTIIRGISGQTIPSGAAVLVAANGQLGTATSSRRFKNQIKSMDKASEALFSLKPVTFRYKKEIDPAGAQQFGLVAEDVEKINPDLVVRDESGKVNTVRYDQVNVMLLNEFLKEHRKVEEQQATIAELKSTVAEQQKSVTRQQAQIQDLTCGLQKVSAGVGMSKPKTEVVLNNL